MPCNLKKLETNMSENLPGNLSARIAKLTATEKTAIRKIAAYYARTVPCDSEDLLHEVFLRVLAGGRLWPPDLDAIPFFRGTVKSIAWEWRKARHREALSGEAAVEPSFYPA